MYGDILSLYQWDKLVDRAEVLHAGTEDKLEDKLYCTTKGASRIWPATLNPLPYDIFRGTQPMACGLFGPTEMTTLSVLKSRNQELGEKILFLLKILKSVHYKPQY
jgi:hypothetical protein